MATGLGSGSTLGGYRIEDVAGRGGMGVVYRAIQLGLNRRVALKVIAPDLAQDSGFRDRFKHESEIAASIDHPNVIPVYEAGEQDGQLFLSMRYVEGTDLRALIKGHGRLDARRAAGIIAQVGEALDAAHKRGLVHRDVKPANILIGEGEHAYLTDFGLTKHAESASGLTKTGTWVGTVDYVAPEQIEGKTIDARTDVYALGCVLFHSLTGQIPFPRPSEIAKIYAHLHDDPPPVDWHALGISPDMGTVIARALAKDPSNRYPSAGDLGRAAVAAAEHRPVAVPERTVAIGAAAPAGATQAYTVAPTATGATQPLPAAAGAPPPQYTPPYPQYAPQQYTPPPYYDTPPPQQRSPRWPLVLAAVIVLLAGAGVAIAFATGAFKSKKTDTVVQQQTQATNAANTAPTPSVSQVQDVLSRYSSAYSSEDSSALESLFTSDFTRSDPPKAVQDRSAAMQEYDRQFSQLTNPSYSLKNVTVKTSPGAAEANATYTVTADNASPASGQIYFHMKVENGELKIDQIKISS